MRCGIGTPSTPCLAVLSEVGVAKSKETLEKELSKRLEAVNKEVPGYKRIATMVVVKEPWTVENGLTTPTLKIKRNQVDKKYEENYTAWHNDEAAVLFED